VSQTIHVVDNDERPAIGTEPGPAQSDPLPRRARVHAADGDGRSCDPEPQIIEVSDVTTPFNCAGS
jgi:hypothetical protein